MDKIQMNNTPVLDKIQRNCLSILEETQRKVQSGRILTELSKQLDLHGRLT